MKYLLLTSYTLLFFVFACKPKELPVPAHNAGDVITTTVNMESNYKWQIYYDLEENKIVSKNQKDAWDIAFETSESGYNVMLNSSKSMFAYKTNYSVAASVTDTIGFGANKQWDASSGDFDFTAFGNWTTHDKVYLIDRGYSSNGIALGFVKIKMVSVSTTAYVFQYASLNNSYSGTCTLNKNNDYNFVYFSFDTKSEVQQIEPPKNSWDLCFTQYTYTFYNPTQPYLVTGCLTNRYQTGSTLENTTPFQNITLSGVENYSFSSLVDAIGYDWKEYVGDTYLTHPEKIYLIKNRNGLIFKLHFIDFYSAEGGKGNPTWEYQKL